jgi:hypothetical protein
LLLLLLLLLSIELVLIEIIFKQLVVVQVGDIRGWNWTIQKFQLSFLTETTQK